MRERERYREVIVHHAIAVVFIIEMFSLEASAHVCVWFLGNTHSLVNTECTRGPNS